jgi:spermidine synthase
MPHTLLTSTRVVMDGLGENTWTLYEVKDTAVDCHTEFQRAAIHTHSRYGKMLFLDGELQRR